VTTVVPVQSAQQLALAEIDAGLAGFASTVNAKGAALQASDLLPYLDPDLLDDGHNRSQFAAEAAGWMAGATVAFSVLEIRSLDTGANTADVVFRFTLSQGGDTQTENVEFFFKKSSGTWLMSGNRRIAMVHFAAEARSHQGLQPPASGQVINVDIEPPLGAVTGVTVSGGGIWSSTALTKGPVISDPAGNRDHFYLASSPLASPPAAGTPFTVALATAGGPVAYTLPLNAWTSERIAFTNLSGFSLSTARLGSPLTVSWTLPKTFPIANMDFTVMTFTGPQSSPDTMSCFESGPRLAANATSTTVTIPATCAGRPVVQLNLNLGVNGANGERSHAIYEMQ